MPLKVLIIPDKFKGTLTAGAAAEAIASGWHRARPQDVLEKLPISDGGDGFGEVLQERLDAKVQSTKTLDAAHRNCIAKWWWQPKTKTAIIESAGVIGLAMLPPKRFHPFELDTFGLGALIRAASSKGAKRCLIGIGGSATNDGGFGLARALGWEFFDREGRAIEQWTGLAGLGKICPPRQRRWFEKLVVAVDVQNPLLGPRGATRVYGPQKGLRAADFQLAENCLRQLARVMDRGLDLARVPGAGAAGGLGFGALAFLRARLEPGFEIFARYAQLDRQIKQADLVLTGEGAIDKSTLMGKGVGQIAQCCRKLRIPCIALAGMIAMNDRRDRLFSQTHSLTDLTTVRDAKARPAFWLEHLAAHAAHEWLM